MGVDISSSTRPGSAIVTVGVKPDGKKHVLDIQVGAWNSPTFVDKITACYNTHRHQMILVENNAVQTMLVEWLQENRLWLPIEGYHTGKQKFDPNIGLPSLDVEFENKAWCIPGVLFEGHGSVCQHGEVIDDKPTQCVWCRFKNEFADHPQYETTDLVMACFTPDTYVRCKEGQKPISEVKIGDTVLTHKGNWKRVTEVHTRPYNGELLEVYPWGSRSFKVTPEHPFYASETWFDRENGSNRLKPKGFSWILAKDLRAGRKEKGSYLFTPKEKQLYCSSKGVEIGKYYMPLNYDFGWILGYFLAEGSTSDHQVSWASHDRETKQRNSVKKFFNGLGINVSISKQKKTQCTSVYISNATFTKFFKKFGSRANKSLPPEFLNTPLEFQRAIVDGWYSGDGWIYKERQQAVSISREIIDIMQLILRRHGITSSLNIFTKGGLKEFKVRGKSQMAVIKPAEKLTLNRQQTKALKEGEAPNPTNTTMSELKNGFTIRIRKIEQLQYEGTVYNLEVEDDNSYCVENIAVHNCWFAREAIRQYWGTGDIEAIEPEVEGIFGEADIIDEYDFTE